MLTLRPHQEEALVEMRAAHKDSPVLVAPCGWGKTALMAKIFQGANAKGKRCMVIAHRADLIEQTAARFTEYGLKCGIVMGSKSAADAPVIVASIQTLVRRAMPVVAVALIDECHLAAGASYAKVIAKLRAQGTTVCGVTATPCRLDGKGLGSVGFERLILHDDYEELFDNGWLVRPKIFAPSKPDLAGVSRVAGDWNTGQLAERCNVIVGDVADYWYRHGRGKAAMAFAVNVAHSIKLRDELRKRGAQAEHVDGDDPVQRRTEVLAQLAKGEIDVVTNCRLMDTGIDLPRLEYLILARPTESLALYRQQAGRVMRPAKGKSSCMIADHAGNVHRHGFPWGEIPWTLEGVKKKKAKPGEEAPAGVKVCGECFAVCPSGCTSCPECGEEFPKRSEVEQKAGSLVEIEDQLITKIGAKGVAEELFPGDGKAVTYAYIVRKALARRYKPGWVAHAFKHIYGSWPPHSYRDIEVAIESRAS